MRIYFTRHGESHANLQHQISNRKLRHGLTQQGRAQALRLAARLQGIPVARIYSSPILRAVETSILLAERLAVEYEITDALREYDCGIMEGRSDERAWQAWQKLFDAWTVRKEWDRRIEAGESFHDIRRRFEPFIEGLVRDCGNAPVNVGCVGHGGLYWMMLPLVLKNVDAEIISRYGFDYAACIVAEWRSTSLFCVEWNGHAIDVPDVP